MTDNQIVINEILAKNDSLNQDLTGQFEDWLELYNSTNETIDLSGLFLSDDKANLTKWQFGSGVAISPNQYLIVWCDEDGSQQGIHTNFKLSVDGEFLAIIDKDGMTIIDSITFPKQSANISYGRFPDSENNWQFMDPSPEAKNIDFVNVSDDYSVTNFELFQNYPNPFNPSTTIKYSIHGNVEALRATSLRVYDILGNEVATLVNQNQKPGNYEVTFNAKNLSSGIYFYRLHVGSFSKNRKLVLLK